MYKDFFRFISYPFHNTPDPAFYFNSVHHREALAMLVYGVQESKGFMLITGDVGTGKTMLVQALKREFGDKHIMVDIANPWVSAEDVLSAIRARIGLRDDEAEEPALLDVLKERLSKLADEGRRVVLVLDEAHQIPERTLEGIRLFSNIESNTRKLIQIILLGQDELSTMLRRYSMRQIQQRIALSYHLQSLDEAETGEYIGHRLRAAGGDPTLFPAQCVALIYRESLGCPRVINHICDNCLLFAYGKFSSTIDAQLTREVIASMHLENHAPAGQPAADAAPPPAADGAARVPTASVATTAAPARPDSAPLPPPFQIPTEQKSPPRAWLPPAQRGASRVGLRRFGMALLISAFALNAAALWLLFGKRIDVRSLWSTAQTEPVAPAQRTVPVDSLPGPSAGGALLSPTPIAAVTPGALAEAAMPMPSISIANEVTVTPQAGLALLASQQYGAWNATVRDLIVTANPSLGNPDTLPPETKVRLPALTRDTMVVQDRDGKFSVYYATFDSEDLARHDLEAMKPTWTSAQVAKVERQGATVFRLYLGAFASRAEADTAAKTLSFKYLPALT